MNNALSLRHRHRHRLKALIDFARKEGWRVVHAPGGQLTLTKQGMPIVYAGGAAWATPAPGHGRREALRWPK